MKIAILSYGSGGDYFTRAVRVKDEIKNVEDLPEITDEILRRAGIEDSNLADKDSDEEASWVGLYQPEKLPTLSDEWVPKDLMLNFQTYYGSAPPEAVAKLDLEEFDEPTVPVLVREDGEGIRIVLGSHNHENMEAPDIAVERRPSGWAIFLHPQGGGDPSGYIYFHDDSRSWVIPESGIGSAEVIEMVEEIPPEIDQVPGATASQPGEPG